MSRYAEINRMFFFYSISRLLIFFTLLVFVSNFSLLPLSAGFILMCRGDLVVMYGGENGDKHRLGRGEGYKHRLGRGEGDEPVEYEEIDNPYTHKYYYLLLPFFEFSLSMINGK